MNKNKFNLLLCLTTTSELLSRSTVNGWPDESPIDCRDVIGKIIECIFNDKAVLPNFWNIQYLPTGPIREISMNNGWHDAYLQLSALWDENNSYFIKLSAQQGDAPEPAARRPGDL